MKYEKFEKKLAKIAEEYIQSLDENYHISVNNNSLSIKEAPLCYSHSIRDYYDTKEISDIKTKEFFDLTVKKEIRSGLLAKKMDDLKESIPNISVDRLDCEYRITTHNGIVLLLNKNNIPIEGDLKDFIQNKIDQANELITVNQIPQNSYLFKIIDNELCNKTPTYAFALTPLPDNQYILISLNYRVDFISDIMNKHIFIADEYIKDLTEDKGTISDHDLLDIMTETQSDWIRDIEENEIEIAD